MNRITQLQKHHKESLEKHCSKNGILLTSIEILLEAEKSKKLLKRNSLIQQQIDKEIENKISNENK